LVLVLHYLANVLGAVAAQAAKDVLDDWVIFKQQDFGPAPE
jgi:hypothetical protein